MNRKLALIMALTLLVGTLSLAFSVQKAKASGTTYIRADGRIDPPAVPITTVDNATYTFTSDISSPIVVERDNILIDGAGYTVQTAFYEIGIDLSYRSNVTVKNTVVRNAFVGIYLNYTTAANLIGNHIMNSGCGILLRYSPSSNISRNSITASQYDGIQLYYSSNNNRISENSIANGNNGITIYESSSNNSIGENTVRNNAYYGINVGNSADNNSISENIVTNNGYAGINLESSSNNTISGNDVTDNAGGIGLVSSSSNTISGNNITANNGHGIYLFGSFNTFFGNNISANNGTGIYITESSNNTIFANSITANNNGIYLYGSYNNSIFHNNFGNNTHQIAGEPYFINTWDGGYPSGGNYWSNYTGIDVNSGSYQNETGSDGIGDTPHIIDANNVDHYPLMVPIAIPEFQSFLVLPLLFIATLLAIIIYRRRIERARCIGEE